MSVPRIIDRRRDAEHPGQNGRLVLRSPEVPDLAAENDTAERGPEQIGGDDHPIPAQPTVGNPEQQAERQGVSIRSDRPPVEWRGQAFRTWGR